MKTMKNTGESDLEYIKHTLEPIVDTDNGRLQSFEIISYSKNRTLLNNTCVNDVVITTLFMRQMEFYQKINGYDDLYQTVFVNADPKLLYEAVSWRNFIPFILQFKIHVGFELDLIKQGIAYPVVSAMSHLKKCGVRFWIINADESLFQLSPSLLSSFDGVKISKHCFWHCFNKENQSLIKRAYTIWGNTGVIIDGVDNQHHSSFLNSIGYMQAQGFYWRAKLSKNLVWH